MNTTYFDFRRYPRPCFDRSTWKSIVWPVLTLLMLVALLPRITLAEQSAMLEGGQDAAAQSNWTSQIGVLAKPGAGLKRVGVKVDVMRVFANQWNLVGKVKHERLLGDTADSPSCWIKTSLQ